MGPDLITDWLHAPRPDTGLHFLEDDGSWRHVSYEDLAGRVWAMAAGLAEHGLAGRRLGLVAATGEDFVVQVFATLATGGTCVPVPHFLPGQDAASHARQVDHVLKTARPAALLHAPDAPVVDGWPTFEVPAYADLSLTVAPSLASSSEPAVVQFTTGTSGAPKGVRVSRRALSASLEACSRVIGLTADDGIASWLPFWHIGNVLPPAATQCDLFLMTPLQFLQDPAVWLRCLGRLSCTVTFSPSFGYLHVLNTVTPEAVADCRFDDWRVAVVATEPPRAGDLDAFVAAFGPLGFRREALCPTYGLTETTLVATLTPPGRGPVVRPGDEGPSALVGSGRPVPGCRVAVRLPDGSDAPEGVAGEIFVGGENLADGYEPGLDFGEWVATGDAGCMYDGELFVLGRTIDSFQVRGDRWFAADAEAQIQARVPGALAVAVVPSRVSGVGITVVMESAQDWAQATLDEEARAISALYGGIDVDLIVLPPGGIPRTSSGKPQRRECFARYVAGTGTGPSAEDMRVMHEQTALEDDGTLAVIRAYADEHVDSYGGQRFVDTRPVAVEVFFTDGIDEHRRALRARVAHPDRLVVSPCRHSRAEVERVRPVVEDEVFTWARGRVPGASVGPGIGHLAVSIHAGRGTDAEEAAARFLEGLRARYGDLVVTSVDVPLQLAAEVGG